MRRSCGYPDLRNDIIGNNPALRIRGNSCIASPARKRALDLSKVSIDQRAGCTVILAGIVPPESFIQHDITGL
jgi:hypothetical protein